MHPVLTYATPSTAVTHSRNTTQLFIVSFQESLCPTLRPLRDNLISDMYSFAPGHMAKNTSHRLVIDTYPLRSLTIGTIRITAHNPRAGGGFCVTRYQTRVQFARSPSALSERRSLNVGLVVVVVGARTPPHRGGADDVVQDMQAAYSLDAPTEARRAPAMSGDQTDPPTPAYNTPSNQTQSRAITPGSGPLCIQMLCRRRNK